MSHQLSCSISSNRYCVLNDPGTILKWRCASDHFIVTSFLHSLSLQWDEQRGEEADSRAKLTMKMELNYNGWQHIQHKEDYIDNIILGQSVVCECDANVYLCVCICVCVCAPAHNACTLRCQTTHVQRAGVRKQLAGVNWVLGIQLRPSSSAASAFTHWAISPSQDYFRNTENH